MKQIGLILVLAFMLLVAGCSSGTNDAKNNGFTLDSSFNGGEDALKFSFVENQPPAEVIGDKTPIRVRIALENIGEADIEENTGRVVLVGFNPEDLNLNPEDKSQALPALRGVSVKGGNVISGGISQVTFDGLRYLGPAPYTQPIVADICYPYSTESVVSLCISGETATVQDEDSQICDLTSERDYANSGAPVKIENVKQMASGSNSIDFQFDIIHTPVSDSARIFKLGVFDNECKISGHSVSSADASVDEDYVSFTVVTGIPGLNCDSTGSGSGEAYLVDGKTTVYCTQETAGQEDYEKPIQITLNYGYFDRISTEINVLSFD